VEIRYEVAGRGEPALVFVHGWSCDRSYWRAQMDHFASAHRVVALDLGGHGESGLARESWTMAAFGDDVRAVVEELDLPRVILVGHSMGTYVIFEAARLMPDRVVALVPVDQIFDPDQGFGEEERERFLAGLRADFSTATQAFVRQYLFGEGADSALAKGIAADMAAAPPAVAPPSRR
jgi:pimeloyl-ACP methyl ester carboxylesterase